VERYPIILIKERRREREREKTMEEARGIIPRSLHPAPLPASPFWVLLIIVFLVKFNLRVSSSSLLEMFGMEISLPYSVLEHHIKMEIFLDVFTHKVSGNIIDGRGTFNPNRIRAFSPHKLGKW